jgi:hypothetical protein
LLGDEVAKLGLVLPWLHGVNDLTHVSECRSLLVVSIHTDEVPCISWVHSRLLIVSIEYSEVDRMSLPFSGLPRQQQGSRKHRVRVLSRKSTTGFMEALHCDAFVLICHLACKWTIRKPCKMTSRER